MLKYLMLLSILFITPAQAAAPQLIGEYDDWSAYFYKDTVGTVCYAASIPKKDEGKYSQRGDIYATVTHRPHEKSFDVVNFVAGYNYKPGTKVEVKIGEKAITKLFADKDKAWAMNDAIDKELVEVMKRGQRMIIHGTSSKGTDTKDTYSLRGFSSAYKAISAKCGKK